MRKALRLAITSKVFLQIACAAANANDVVAYSYKGPDKTAFIIDQAVIVARYFGKNLVREDRYPSLYIFSDSSVFDKVKDERYLQREFGNSPPVVEALKKGDYSGRICVSFTGNKQDGSPVAVIVTDAALDNREIEVCTLDMLQRALK